MCVWGGGVRGGSSLPRDSNGEGHPCWESQAERTLEAASSVTSRRRMAPRQQRQATLSGRQGWGPAVAWQLTAELYSPGSPRSLSGILQQPWTKESRTNYRPTKSSCCCSSTSLFTPICPAHSRALRPAEGTNLMVRGTHPQPGDLLGHCCLPPTHGPVGCQDGICLRVGTGVPGPLGPGTLVFHSRKDSRVLPS